MTDTAKRIGPASIANAEGTLYTCPAATTAMIQWIHIANVTGSPATVKLSVGADAVGTRLLPDLSIPANSTYDWTGFLPLAAAETLRATGGTNNALTFTAGAVEVS